MLKLQEFHSYMEEENVSRFYSPCRRLVGFDYNKTVVFNRLWNDVTKTARGLAFDRETGEVVGRSLDKFFNLHEAEVGGVEGLPKENFIELEKADGSMISAFWYVDEWIFMTRGSFISTQAAWAKQWATKNMKMDLLDKTQTHVLEAIYPQNRIVVNYGDMEELKLIAVRDPITGDYKSYEYMQNLAAMVGCGIVKRYTSKDVNEIVEKCKTLSMNEEGFVLRFDSGFMVKIKGEEYCKVHRIISHVTPLAFWRSIDVSNFKVPTDYLTGLPEEFRSDINELVRVTEQMHQRLFDSAMEGVKSMPHFELDAAGKKARFAYVKSHFHPDTSSMVLDLMNGKEKNVRVYIHRLVRPSRNLVEGVVLSESLQRFLAEDDDG